MLGRFVQSRGKATCIEELVRRTELGAHSVVQAAPVGRYADDTSLRWLREVCFR